MPPSGGGHEVGVNDDVVLVVPGVFVEGPAAGDEPQARVVDVAVHLLRRGAAVAPTMEMTWQAAETLAEQHMRRIGFADAAVTASGADGGLDVVSAQAVAQVKHHAAPVSAPALQQTVGAAPSAALVLFYALAGYTRAAT